AYTLAITPKIETGQTDEAVNMESNDPSMEIDSDHLSEEVESDNSLVETELVSSDEDTEKYELQKMLEMSITAARVKSEKLNPPLPIEAYSPLNKLGGMMLCNLVSEAIIEWEMINNTVWGDNYPEIQGNGLELYKLLVEQEVKRLGKEMNEENFTTVGKDAIRFLELAINNAEGQIIDRPNLDPLYNRVRIFHHYFSAYRKNLLTEIPLRDIPNRHIIKFIMKEYDKSPIPKPQTLEEAGIEAFKNDIANFLQSAEGQHFLTSSYARNFVNPGKLIPNSQARSYWAFILLYWRYKNYWNKDHPLEQASTSDILEFLTQYYKQYWQEEISAQLSIRELGVHQVFSIFSTEQTIPAIAYKHSTNTTYDNRNLQEFTEIITPPRKATNNLGPPPLNKIRRIMDKNNLASLGPSIINYQDYSSPPTPSRPPLKMRNTRTDHELSHLNKSVIQNPPDSHIQVMNSMDESNQDDSNKENIPPRQFKQERKPVISPLVFKVMARDTRTIITDDKSIDYGR
ncbi:MAG TPA: hypothetical protein VEP90_18240, partial [Methylomirabilota bacterium]|nr:hypothetical protein [Methylomirabilota bacterium]